MIEAKIAMLNEFLLELRKQKKQVEIKLNSYDELPKKLNAEIQSIVGKT